MEQHKKEATECYNRLRARPDQFYFSEQKAKILEALESFEENLKLYRSYLPHADNH